MTETRLVDGVLLVGDLPVLSDVGVPSVSGATVAQCVDALGDGVWEFRARVEAAESPIRVERADALRARVSGAGWAGRHFTSDWGAEFTPVVTGPPALLPLDLVGRHGRSSRGLHPLLALERPGAALLVTVAWSGNWHISLDTEGVLTAGISPHDFSVELAEGESFTAPSVIVAAAKDLDSAGTVLAHAVGRLIPRTPWSDAMPTEWNHWWPYEDVEIDEETFLAEARAASGVGLEVATLDAGWFGRPEAGSDWQAERGDWAEVNTARFPSGLPALAGSVRDEGAAFGIWVEAEAVGASSRLRRERPELMATRSVPDGVQRMTVSLDAGDPTFLGYVCLGSAAGRAFVASALNDTVSSTEARWLKLDFNVDPGSGCDRTDHGHGAGDGLLRHYEGLYAVLDEFRAAHPEVVLEACASGGLRIDLGLARHVHCFFLSDPDWTEHHLQVLWGASLMLPPAAMLHWSWSQWRGENPDQDVDFASLGPGRFATMLRAAMLHRFGVSMRLTELPVELRDVFTREVDMYRREVAPLLRDGIIRRLTEQPLRRGSGERYPAFQVDSAQGHLLAAFSLDEDSGAPIAFRGLDAAAGYEVRDLATGAAPRRASGAELMGAPRLAAPSASSLWVVARRI